MIRDLRTILDGWDFEPGKISCRRILGRDGREKLQTRIDLGVMQLECTGRPDGLRPSGCESLLEWHGRRLREHIELYGDDEDFALGPDDCREMRHEAYLYYQRYLAYFVLEEYDGVERDTARNLQAIDFCERYAAAERDRAILKPQRPYVLMMHTRARVHRALAEERAADALRAIDDALTQLRRLARPDEEDLGLGAEEIQALEHLRADTLAHLPPHTPERMRAELAEALQREDYERAAALRDALKLPRRKDGA